jgi:hypothetical protein
LTLLQFPTGGDVKIPFIAKLGLTQRVISSLTLVQVRRLANALDRPMKSPQSRPELRRFNRIGLGCYY